MSPIKNFKHRFDLNGTKPGDWFLGCDRCWQRLEPNVIGPYRCDCGNTRSHFTVTPEDHFIPVEAS